MTMGKTAIIMLFWNNLEYTKKCIASIYENTDKSLYDIILINNGSVDGTKEYLNSLSENIAAVVHNKENLGFGLAANIGMKMALDMGYDQVCLLNNDTEVQPNWLMELRKCAGTNDKIGMVQAAIFNFENKSTSCGVEIDLFSENHLKLMDLGKTPADIENITVERLYLNGACLLITKPFLEDVGMFSPEFFPIYHEETDLCIRGHRKGWKLMFCGKSKVKHHVAASSQKLPDRGEQAFWSKWALILDKYRPYFNELCENKYGIEYNKLEMEKYGKNISIESSTKNLAEEWNAKKPKTEEEIQSFYKENSNYVGDLVSWNNSQYKKDIIKHVAYACKYFGVKEVLDIGAGILSDSIYLSNQGLNVTSLDFDSEHYRFGQFRLKSRGIKNITVKHIGDSLNVYDAIMMFDVIEHIKDPDKFLDQYIKHTKKMIFMTVPENIPPDEAIRHPMHLIEYADFWKQIPDYLKRHGFKRLDLVTFKREG